MADGSVRLVDLDRTTNLLRTCITVNEDVDNGDSLKLKYGQINDAVKTNLTDVETIMVSRHSDTVLRIHSGTRFNYVYGFNDSIYNIRETVNTDFTLGVNYVPDADGVYWCVAIDIVDQSLMQGTCQYTTMADGDIVYDYHYMCYYYLSRKGLAKYGVDTGVITYLFCYSGKQVYLYSNYEMTTAEINTLSPAVMNGQTLIYVSYNKIYYSRDASGTFTWYDKDEVEKKYIDFVLENIPAIDHKEGRLHWNDNDNTLNLDLSATDVSIQIGQEIVLRAFNKTGDTIYNGQVVIITGSQGNRPTVDLAQSDAIATSMCTIAMATHDVENNKNGYFTTYGIVRGFDTSAFTEGDILYLSDTVAGGLVDTIPSPPSNNIRVGIVLLSHATTGMILFNVRNESYQTLKVGGDTDYTEIEATGFPVQRGGAIAYRDEYVSGDWLPASASAAPDQNNYTIGGVASRKYSFDGVNTEERISNCFEIPHDYLYGGEIEVHVHFRPSTTDSGNVKWFFDWEHSAVAQPPASQTSLSVVAGISASSQYTHYVVTIDYLPNTNTYQIGDIINFNLRRDPNDEDDTYGYDVILEKVALHVPVDTMGSREIYTK